MPKKVSSDAAQKIVIPGLSVEAQAAFDKAMDYKSDEVKASASAKAKSKVKKAAKAKTKAKAKAKATKELF